MNPVNVNNSEDVILLWSEDRAPQQHGQQGHVKWMVTPEVLHTLKAGRRKVSDGVGDWNNEPQTPAVLFSRWNNNTVPLQTSRQGTRFYILMQTTNEMWFCFHVRISAQDGEQWADQLTLWRLTTYIWVVTHR